jgi:hypothetical protein
MSALTGEGMMTSGVVKHINRQRGIVAILTPNAAYTIIELLSDQDINIGDQMQWRNETGMGSETYTNVTQSKSMDVYVQNHWVPEQQLRQQLLIK